MRKLVLLLSSLLFTQLAYAYQFDIGVSHASSSEDRDFDNVTDDETEIRTNLLGGTFYFSDVSTENGPWKEAPFLSKASGISLGLARGEYTVEDDCCDGDVIDADTKGMFFNIRGVINRFVIELDIDKVKEETNSGSLIQYDEVEDKTNTLTIGHYIGENQQWYVLLLNGENYDGDDRSGFGGGYKGVFSFPNGQHLSVDASIVGESIDSDYDEASATFAVQVDYFLSQQLSLDFDIISEASTADVDGPDPESSTLTYLAGATFFPTQSFYIFGQLGFSVSEYDNYYNDDAEGDGGEFRFGLGGRF